MSVLKNKIISSDKDLIGIVFFGTVCTKHSETKQNKSHTVLKNSKKDNLKYIPSSESFTLLFD